MRVRHDKDAINYLNENKTFFITDPLKQHGKWRWFFGNNKPLYLEVGAGKGNFIIQMALQNPNINFIALEKDSTILAKAVKKAQKIVDSGYVIYNLKFINGDASKLEFMFDDNEIDLIYLNFSDPWPKKRQTKRRLTYESFLKQYYQILKPQAQLIFKTDNLGLFEYSLQSFKQNEKYFKIIYQTFDLYNDLNNSINLNNVQTEYEAKFVKLNNKINKLVAQSNKKI